MSKSTYYAARALGRAVVRERTRAMKAKERAMKKNPELFQNKNVNNDDDMDIVAAVISMIIVTILVISFLVYTS